MANLLDTIRQNSQPQKVGVTDESNKLQTLLRAKSGKSVGGSGIAASNLGEQQAVVDTNTQLQSQVAPAAELQNQSLAGQQQGQQQQEQIQTAEIEQGRKFDTIQSRLKTEATLSEFERNKGQIDLNRDRARVEQLGQQIRLQDKKYTDNLQREGQKSRLDDELEFRKQLTKSTLGDSQEILEKGLKGKSVLDANDREFSKSLAQMGIDDAWSMFRSQQRADQQRALYTGIASVTGAGVGAYGQASDISAANAAKENAAAVSTARSETASQDSDLARMRSRQG
jgi:hypothetical protein